MKLYKDYTKKPYSFLVNDTTLPSENPLRFGRTYYEISICERIKAINYKIKQNKAQYDLDRQTTKISALSSANASKYGNYWERYFDRKRIVRKICNNEKI